MVLNGDMSIRICQDIGGSPTNLYADLTQLGEYLPYKEKVAGSSPAVSTMLMWLNGRASAL